MVYLFQAQKPDPLPLWMNTFQPLDSPVWLCLLAVLSFCIAFIHVLNKMIPSFDFDILLLFALPLGEERKWPNNLRIFFIVYTFAIMVVITAYKGGLLSCLAIPVIPSPIGELLSKIFIYDTSCKAPSLDTIEELALSPLSIEAFNTAGKGLEKGLSPTLDIIVDKYSDAAESDAPDEHVTRIKEGKIAK